MNSTTTFKPSIIHYSSVSDCEMIIDELQEDLDEKVAELDIKAEQARRNGKYDLANSYLDQSSTFTKVKIMLLDKKAEVNVRYRSK